MTDIIETAISKLNERLSHGRFKASARFEISDEGTIYVDEQGACRSDCSADVTLQANAQTFHSLLVGKLNPLGAVLSGKLRVNGDTHVAMELAKALQG
ncbi:MAG: SCP2 sterol-binding domain-containing protein [Aestuariivita sp.]|nr:SCP2 sterol-binding domain-containing protein [Aestuariivita sp.]